MQPCQKHPSTKIATFLLRKTKSGLPGSDWCRRQPTIPWFLSSPSILPSVLRLPLPRIRDITSDLFCLVQMSATAETVCKIQGDLQRFLGQLGPVRGLRPTTRLNAPQKAVQLAQPSRSQVLPQKGSNRNLNPSEPKSGPIKPAPHHSPCLGPFRITRARMSTSRFRR